MEETPYEFIEARLLTPDELARQGGLRLLRLGRSIAKPNYVSGPRELSHYSLQFILEGQAEVQQGPHRKVLSKGDAFCVFPGTIYRMHQANDDKPLRTCWISFDGPQAGTLLRRAGFDASSPFRELVDWNELRSSLRNLFAISSDGVKGYLRFQSALYSIFDLLIVSEPAIAVREEEPAWLPYCIEFMKAHSSEGIQVQDVADRLSLHRAYFSQAFARHVGLAPVKYVEKLKMEKSVELLRTTSYSIREIALTLGYSDPYTFTRAFARVYGMPPGRWRKTRGMN